jgi:phage-related protein
MRKVARLSGIHGFAVAAVVGLLSGCGSGGQVMDDESVRATLTRTLDAWVAGTPARDLEQAEPSVIVVDHQWSEGARLVDYDMVGAGSFDGQTLRAQVELQLLRPRERAAVKTKAEYIVGTHPVITVVRAME